MDQGPGRKARASQQAPRRLRPCLHRSSGEEGRQAAEEVEAARVRDSRQNPRGRGRGSGSGQPRPRCGPGPARAACSAGNSKSAGEREESGACAEERRVGHQITRNGARRHREQRAARGAGQEAATGRHGHVRLLLSHLGNEFDEPARETAADQQSAATSMAETPSGPQPAVRSTRPRQAGQCGGRAAAQGERLAELAAERRAGAAKALRPAPRWAPPCQSKQAARGTTGGHTPE